MLEVINLWSTASDLLRSQVSDGVWQSTFAQLTPIRVEDDELVLGMPNGIIRDKLDGRYRPLVEDAVAEAADRDIKVTFELTTPTLFDATSAPATSTRPGESADTGQPFTDAADDRIGVEDNVIDLRSHRPEPTTTIGVGGATVAAPSGSEVGQATVANRAGGDNPDLRRVDVPDNDPSARYTFRNFVTGPSNRFAVAAALSVAERPGGSYNPLFIYGSAGLGKTHILRAIQNFINDLEPNRKILYVSTETFLNEFVDSIRNNSGNEFKRRYRQMDVLLIDDIQFIEGKDRLQEELFHTFNELYGANSQIVLSSDRPPDAIPTLEERLKSRFMMGLLTDIQPPDIETRMAILRKRAERDGLELDNEVSEFIAANITNNIRELEGALNKVTAYANLTAQSLDRGLAEQVLGDFIADRQPRPITVDMILESTVEQFGFPRDELIGKSRRRPLVIARQMAMYVTRELTDLSYPHIAREFGGRDHTTVMHACDKISALMKERTQIYNHVTTLEKSIRAQAQTVDFG